MADLVGPIQHKRGTSAQWTASQIPLRDGELGVDTTLRRVKIGDGATLWAGLPWFSSDAATMKRLEDLAADIDGAVSPNDTLTAAILSQQNSASRKVLSDTIVAGAPLASGRVFTAEAFGADPSGASDSRVALQNAMNAAREAGGGTVMLDGVYRVDAPLVPRSNVTLQGRGWNRSVLKPTAAWNGGAGGSILEVGGTAANPISNFAVYDIKFDLTDVPTNVQAKAIFVTFMRNLRFENNYVLNSTATGIGADFLDKSIIRGNRVEGAGRYAQGNEASRLGCSGIGIGTGVWGDEATVVSENFVINPVRYGVFVEYQEGISGFFTTGVKIVDNHIVGAHWGIGSDGVAWAHIVGNSIEGSDMDGIHLGPGNAGGKSWGDLIALNTVRGSGRHGLMIDFTNAGNGTPAKAGRFMIVNNRFVENTGCGIKLVLPSALKNVQIMGNLIAENGSIGLDANAGGITESDIIDNRVVDNTGIGMRFLGSQSKVRVRGNRSGDTRATGRSQTYGIELSATYTFTDFDIDGNDFTNNITAAVNVAGSATLVNTTLRRNKGHGPDAVDALNLAASPMSYAVGARPEQLWVIGGTWSSIQINGQTVLTGPGTMTVEPYDVVTFTYSAAPTAIKRRKL